MTSSTQDKNRRDPLYTGPKPRGGAHNVVHNKAAIVALVRQRDESMSLRAMRRLMGRDIVEVPWDRAGAERCVGGGVTYMKSKHISSVVFSPALTTSSRLLSYVHVVVIASPASSETGIP